MICFTGDIHGQFMPLIYNIQNAGLRDEDVIVAGDIGMGFYDLNYYISTFNALNKRLLKINVHLYFIRGNHDKPDYFNDPPIEFESFSHVHLVHDYRVLHLQKYNILCVGGATSVDRKFRIEGVDWWKNENVLQYDKLICKNIDIVVTHCAPIFCPPSYDRISWMDDELDRKSREERIFLANMYFDLLKNSKPRYWFYGHYHNTYCCELSNEGGFNELEKHYLLSGQTLTETELEMRNRNVCKFIGLPDMFNTDWYKFELG